MKRLTKTYPSGSYGIVGDIDDAVHRLAAIEDILGDEYDLERLKELIKQTGGAKPMRLIDADAIKINYGGLAHIGPYDYEEISKYYLDQIKKQPTVDAALVIRCRECKYGKKSACMPGMVYCQAIHKYKTQNGYCDEGEQTMKLIDADKLVFSKAKGIGDIVNRRQIESMEAIDPVHAAGGCYCRECKQGQDACGYPGMVYCKVAYGYRRQNGFCSAGERRED